MKKTPRIIMRNIFIVALLVVLANVFLAKNNDNNVIINQAGVPDTVKMLEPTVYQSKEDELIYTILSRYHYKKFNLNDSLSAVILKRYLKSLDYSRSYFLASDIKKFDKLEFKIDDDIKDGNISPVYQIFNIFRKRTIERMNYAKKLLNKEFNFTLNEKYEVKRDSAPWPKTIEDLNNLWRKKVKNDALNLILAGKKWPGVQKILLKRYNNFERNILQYTNEDVFQIFENSFTESIDPHTNYMSPITSANFRIDMSRSLEGIGAQLQTEDEYTKIVRIIPGGPAFKSKLLHPNDKIIGVAQGKNGDMVDVIGWRITDVVQLIRGHKGSTVRLQIIPASEGVNGKPKIITLVREKVTLKGQSAKDKIIFIKNGNKTFKFGVIMIPAFYSDFEAESRGDKNYKSTTRDVKVLISKLKQQNINGIIIDLRNNGGGSLEEAVKLTGLFIKYGPIVQVRNANGFVREEDDPDSTIFYNGPMAVLVNRFSASASEILAGAIQDYGRGLIIGEQTYGKGTVQNLINLSRLIPSHSSKFGQLKLTIAKFYRITGKSTQDRGVEPDIKFPSPFKPGEFGESSQPSALPYDQINPTKYIPYGNIKKYLPKLQQYYNNQVKNNPEFDEYIQEIQDYKLAASKKYVSLNEAVRKKEQKLEEQKKFERENEKRKRLGLKLLKKGETPKNSAKKNDPVLNEAGHILGEYIILSS